MPHPDRSAALPAPVRTPTRPPAAKATGAASPAPVHTPQDLELGLDVQRTLNTSIRPLLNIDAGDAEIASVIDGHVRIALLGSCGRCLFRASCAAYTVIDRLDAAFGERGATFEVLDTPVPPQATRLPSAYRSERRSA